MAESGSLTVYPGAYDASSSSVYSINSATNPVGKGTSNASYASFTYGTAFWSFDVSAIPRNAEINSVSCKVKANRTSSSSSGSVSLCSGNTEKGTATSLGTSATVYTLSVGTWTREELSSVRLKFVLGGTNVSRYIYFYGAELTIVYTYENQRFMLRLDGDNTTLPDGYTKLTHIRSTGEQYIDLGFAPNNNSRIILSAQLYETPTATKVLFGARTNDTSGVVMCLYDKSKAALAIDYATYTTRQSYGVDATSKLLVDYNKNVVTINGEQKSWTATTFQSASNLVLCALNTQGTIEYKSLLDIDFCQVYDNGTLIRDCYPCLNPSGVPGLYDIVNGVFYGSATSTPFVAGPEYNDVWHDIARTFKKVSGIWIEQTDLANVVDQTKRLVNGGEYVAPYPGYKELPYIESVGQSYIDLGFAPNENTRLVLDIEVTSGGTTFLYGARNNSSANSTSASFSMPQISGTSLRADYGSAETEIAVNPVQRLLIDANKNTTTVNGLTVTTAAQTFQCSYNIFLLSVNTAGTVGPMTAAKLRSCKVYHNGELMRDLIPVESRAGVVGMLDTINYAFYSSATSDPFYAPDNSPTIITFYLEGVAYKAEYGMTWAEYVTSSYNTAGFENWYDTRINGPKGGSIGTSAGFVSPNDVIVSGQTYSY